MTDLLKGKQLSYLDAYMAVMSSARASLDGISHHPNQSTRADTRDLIWDEDEVEYDNSPVIPPKRVFNIKLNIVEVKRGQLLPFDCYEEGW